MLTYTIVISGSLETFTDTKNHWEFIRTSDPLAETVALNFDRSSLLNLTTASKDYIDSFLISYGIF